MKQSKVVMKNRNNVLPPPDIECSSPPCYAHEVDPVYMGLMQTEPQSHDVSAIEKVGAGSNELPETVACSELVSSS